MKKLSLSNGVSNATICGLEKVFKDTFLFHSGALSWQGVLLKKKKIKKK